MSKVLIIAALIGIGLAAAITGYYGLEAVGSAFLAVGWGAAVVAMVRAIETAGAGVCWWFLFPREGRPSVRIFMLLRWVREAINSLLPVAQVGGELVGARLLTFYGPRGSLAGASVIVDLFLQPLTQFVFTLIGVTLLVLRTGDSEIVRWVLLGLAVMAPALTGFFLTQRLGGIRLLEKAFVYLSRNPKWAVLGGITSLHDCLQAIYRRRRGLAAAILLHFTIWFVGVLEVWFALRFMGHPVDYGTALIIESLAQAVRGAAFIVPGAIGVQEGGLVVLCAVFGIPAPMAIALSFVKRVPEIVLGIPGLLIWQGIEGRQLLRRSNLADIPVRPREFPNV